MDVDDLGLALEVEPGYKHPNTGTGEVTKIPTYGFAVGDTLYLLVHVGHYWGDPGQWDANHAGLAKSADGDEHLGGARGPRVARRRTSSRSPPPTSPGRDRLRVLLVIPAGRFGGVALMRVHATTDAVEDRVVHVLRRHRRRWRADVVDGCDGPATVLERSVGEVSVMYHETTERWLLSTMVDNADAVLFEGLTPWGPWSDPHTITTQAQTPGLYSPYLNPRYVSEDGQTLYFTLSIWDPYNVFWYSMDLETQS